MALVYTYTSVNVHGFGYGTQIICSYVLWPLAFLMGVNIPDCRKVAELIGTNTFLTTFIAYRQLSLLIHNREALESHVAANGTWYWTGDDVILRTAGSHGNITLTNGFISVPNLQFSLCTMYKSAVRFDANLTAYRRLSDRGVNPLGTGGPVSPKFVLGTQIALSSKVE